MLNIITKYLLEAFAIALVAYYIPKKKLNFVDIFKISITGAITYLLLDLYSPLVSSGLRLGTGMSIGNNMVNNPLSISGIIPNNNPNPIIGGNDELNQCLNFCNEEEEKEQCIEGCNGLLSGGSFNSNRSQLKESIENEEYQLCMEEDLGYNFCSMLNNQTGGQKVEPTICEELGIPEEYGCEIDL